MTYGASILLTARFTWSHYHLSIVRLGSSGLKISRIILGCMSYGTPEWQGWVLDEEEGIKHIKAA